MGTEDLMNGDYFMSFDGLTKEVLETRDSRSVDM